MGYLLSLSGLDGSGKTTQAECISEVLKKQGLSVEIIHFKTITSRRYLPNIKKRISQYLADHFVESSQEIYQICCAYLFYEKVLEVVLPSLYQNNVTILDRYRDSAMCYHYMKNELFPSAQQIYESTIKPNKSIFLELLPEDCLQRLQTRENLSPFETLFYLNKAYNYYQSNREKFVWIDAKQSSETITQVILSEIGNLAMLL